MKKIISRHISVISFTLCIATILLAAVGCSRTPAYQEPSMNVPDSETIVFTQMEQADTAAWANAAPENAPVLTSQELELSAGGIATLYAFQSDSKPLIAANDITSLSGDLILNSSGVQLGEGLSALKLAENELYRWTGSAGFDNMKYTQPLKISEGRYLVCLEFTGPELHSEQIVVFTELGENLARIDRLWHTIDETATENNTEFDAAANYLISENTL